VKAYLRTRPATPHAWNPLFDANDQRGLARLQFALAGMNAHINRDLMRAVVDVYQETQTDPEDDSPEKRDFDRLNPILEEVETEVHDWYLKTDAAFFDEVETVLAGWSLRHARETAWNQAQGLWLIRNVESVRDRYLQSIDKFVGFAGRSLLVPLPKQGSCLK